MTSEEKREQLLKRVLPALGITIIYFVFINGIFSEKMLKAEEKYQGLVRSGASPAGMTGILRQQSQIQQQLSKLKTDIKKHQTELDKLAGFLANNTASNASTALLSKILANSNIRVQTEAREPFKEENLTAALKEVWQGLKPVGNKKPKAKTKEPEIYVQHLWLTGSYQNMYHALNTIATGDLKALPVSLTMQSPETDAENKGALNWELILWM